MLMLKYWQRPYKFACLSFETCIVGNNDNIITSQNSTKWKEGSREKGESKTESGERKEVNEGEKQKDREGKKEKLSLSG